MSLFDSLPIFFKGDKIYDIVYSKDFGGISDFSKSYNSTKTKKICIVSDSKVASYYMDAILDVVKNQYSLEKTNFDINVMSRKRNTLYWRKDKNMV